MACELRRISNKSIRQALVVYLERGMARADADAKPSARRIPFDLSVEVTENVFELRLR
jgi:hypothetical protein